MTGERTPVTKKRTTKTEEDFNMETNLDTISTLATSTATHHEDDFDL